MIISISHPQHKTILCFQKYTNDYKKHLTELSGNVLCLINIILIFLKDCFNAKKHDFHRTF